MGQEAVLAFDLGTGGCKSSLWSVDGVCLGETVRPYETLHPAHGLAEQRLDDWWTAVTESALDLLRRHPGAAHKVAGIALSGQSLGMVLLGADGRPVEDTTPIWSDTRGSDAAAAVFASVAEDDWYLRTGNGFPPGLYPLFKAAWYRRERPETWSRVRCILGSKDWINYRLTGEFATDHSYASGSGAYSLSSGGYDAELLAAGDLDPALLPEPRESTDIVGKLRADAAEQLGLTAGLPVFAGAVDNACMALGSLGTREGRIYAALGSSSWMTVTSAAPILDLESRPYVFRHAIPGLHISALSTFSSGSSFDWLRTLLMPGTAVHDVIELAAGAPRGAGGVLFLPMLAGGTPLEGGPAALGAFTGLHLATDAAQLMRAALEGIAFALRRSLDRMRDLSGSREDLVISGGGSRSALWNRIYADVLNTALLRTSVDQQAATLGAATIAFAGIGAWSFADAERPHTVLERVEPDPAAVREYTSIRTAFDGAVAALGHRAD
jgi:xylulokinase